MREDVTRRWWVFLVRGLLTIAFGVVLLVAPLPGLLALIYVFGVFALADGVVALFGAFQQPGGERWLLALFGACGITVGLLTLVSPTTTAVALYAFIAIWAIIRGITEIYRGVQLRHEDGLLLIIAGVASIVFGGLLLALPAAGVLALVWLISIYAFLLGTFLVYTAVRVKQGRPLPSIPMMPV